MTMTPAGKQSDRWLDLIGIASRILIYACFIGLMYLFKPDDISNKPIGNLTISDLFNGFVWGGIVLGLVCLLLSPSGNPSIRKTWGGLGVVLIASITIWIIYLSRN